MEYVNYTRSDLMTYIGSGKYLAGDIVAITSLRAYSQIENPHVEENDILLTIAFSETNQIVGYIGALPDKANQQKCAWNSCWWVKKGTPAEVSMKLLFMFINNWERKVLFSEMTPHTSKIIEQLRFCKTKTTIGFRGYYRFSLSEVLPSKRKELRKFNILLQFIDFILNKIIRLSDYLKQNKENTGYDITECMELNSSDDLFISRFNRNSPTQRTAQVFNWISKSPWVTSKSNYNRAISSRYYFSYKVKRFESKWVRFIKNGTLQGLVNYNIRDSSLKIMYVYCEPSALLSIADYFLFKIKKDAGISSITTFYKPLCEEFERKKHQFIYALKLPKHSAISENLLNKTTIVEPDFQMGDGDAIFT